MKFIDLNQECIKYLQALFSMQEVNIDYILSIRKYLENPICFPNDEKEFFQSKLKFSNDLCKYLNIENNVLQKRFKNSFIPSNLNYFARNSYYKLISNLSFEYNDLKLKTEKIPAYQAFVFNDLYAQGDSCYITSRLSFSNQEYCYPSISLCDREWMSLHPNEIATMEVPISACKRKILVLGLGIGYFPFMASEKDDVTEVHIVEMDKDIIDTFNKYFLPLFNHKEKIHIHKADAFDFIQNVGDGDYDYIFSDLWHDVSDGIPCYIQLLRHFGSFKKSHCYYWIEDSILTTYRLYVIGILKDCYENYLADEYNEIQKEIYDYLAMYQVHTKEDISSLLTIGGLKRIILKQ